MKLEFELKTETEKQLATAEQSRARIKAVSKKGGELLKNIDAYIADSKYFLQVNKLIEAFEAAVWAWAWLEIGKELKKLR